MRVLVAGATGVIGRQLTPLLTAAGHEVFSLARTSNSRARGAELGARPVAGDLLKRDDVIAAARAARPDAMIHLATAIPPELNPAKFAKAFEPTNRLRTEGMANLIAAAQVVGAQRLIAESVAFAYDPADRSPADEDAPLWVKPPKQFVGALAAVKSVEKQTQEFGGLALRFGHLYGPTSHMAASGAFTTNVRKRKVPVVGGGNAIFSFTHAHDAATAVVAALDKPAVGVLNIVDDDPAPLHEWLPAMAAMLRAPAPRSAPTALARLAIGGWGVAYMTKLRGASNARAKLALDWKPRYASWREGFEAELAGRSLRSA